MGSGKVEILFSGVGATNSYNLAKCHVLGYGETLVVFQNLGGGSGCNPLILGYPIYDSVILGSTYIVLTSGDLIQSGEIGFYSVSDAYEGLDVGFKNASNNQSCAVTVTVSRKRRQ
jgi:hypothetical protein